MIRAYWYEDNKKIEWWSYQPHCSSCIEDKETGYGDDIVGCCCKHSREYEEAKENGTLKELLTPIQIG